MKGMNLKKVKIPEISLRNKRRLIFTALIFTVVIMKKSGFIPLLFSVSPMTMVPITVIIALYEKSIPGMMFGILCGSLWDLTATTPDGFYTVLLAVAGFVCGSLSSFVVRTNLLSSLLLTFFTGAGCSILHWIFFFVWKGYDGAFSVLFTHYLPSVIYTLIFGVVVYYIIDYIEKNTKEKKKRF